MTNTNRFFFDSAICEYEAFEGGTLLLKEIQKTIKLYSLHYIKRD